MTTATTAYRDYSLKEFGDSEFSQYHPSYSRRPVAAGGYLAPRRLRVEPTTMQVFFVFSIDPESSSQVGPTIFFGEPESELAAVVSCEPRNVRKVQIQIASRTKGLPNPILPDLGG